MPWCVLLLVLVLRFAEGCGVLVAWLTSRWVFGVVVDDFGMLVVIRWSSLRVRRPGPARRLPQDWCRARRRWRRSGRSGVAGVRRGPRAARPAPPRRRRPGRAARRAPPGAWPSGCRTPAVA